MIIIYPNNRETALTLPDATPWPRVTSREYLQAYSHAEDVITTLAALAFIASVCHIQRINEAVESDRHSAKISLNQNGDLMHSSPIGWTILMRQLCRPK